MTKPTDKQIESRKKYSAANGLFFKNNENHFGKSTEENRNKRIKDVNEVPASDYANNLLIGMYYEQLAKGSISHPNAISQLNQILEHGKILKH